MNSIALLVTTGKLSELAALQLLVDLRLSVPFRLDGLKLEGYFQGMLSRYRKRGTRKSRHAPDVSSGRTKGDDSPELSAWLYRTSSDEGMLRQHYGNNGLPAGV